MSGFIEDFYYGNIDPQARGVKRNSHIQKQMELLSTNEELLTDKLTGTEKKLFLDFVNASSEVLGANSVDSFVLGFRLGARFMYDSFLSDDAPFIDYTKG